MKFSNHLRPTDRRHSRLLQDFVPGEVFDIHVHPHSAEHFPENYPFLAGQGVLGCREHTTALRRYMPAETIHGLYFGLPHPFARRDRLNEWVAQQVAQKGTSASRALMLVSPSDDMEAVSAGLRSGRFAGMKVYHSFAARSDTMNARLGEYVADWMLELADEVRAVLMVHLVRQEAIADSDNQQDLRRLCRRYPNAQFVLAHIGRSFNHRNARAGLHTVADLDNVVVDTSAVCEADAFRFAFETLGAKRILWGSDFPVSETRGRCVTTGSGFYWLYEESVPADPLADMTLVGIESLLSLREACEDTGQTASDIDDVFRNNALRLLSVMADRPEGSRT